MQIVRIEDLDGYEALKPHWERAHEEDPDATVYTSWGWLRGWIEGTSDSWCILVGFPRGDPTPVAFLPLAYCPEATTLGLRKARELRLAGTPMADHSGLVCRSGFTRVALPALAAATERLMQEIGTSRFSMTEVADPRWDALTRSFCTERFLLSRSEPTKCPRILLPESWEEYMRGSKKRKKLLRRAEEEGFVITHSDDDTIERHIAIFLELHQMRHGPREPGYLGMLTSLLRWSHRAGCLRLLLLWHDEKPAAAHAGFVDRPRRRFHAYNGGWDEWYRRHSPPRVIELYSIRRAIEEGLQVYDLGRGAEAYKFGYGAEPILNRNAVLHRRTPYRSARELVRRLPGVAAVQNSNP